MISRPTLKAKGLGHVPESQDAPSKEAVATQILLSPPGTGVQQPSNLVPRSHILYKNREQGVLQKPVSPLAFGVLQPLPPSEAPDVSLNTSDLGKDFVYAPPTTISVDRYSRRPMPASNRPIIGQAQLQDVSMPRVPGKLFGPITERGPGYRGPSASHQKQLEPLSPSSFFAAQSLPCVGSGINFSNSKPIENKPKSSMSLSGHEMTPASPKDRHEDLVFLSTQIKKGDMCSNEVGRKHTTSPGKQSILQSVEDCPGAGSKCTRASECMAVKDGKPPPPPSLDKDKTGRPQHHEVVSGGDLVFTTTKPREPSRDSEQESRSSQGIANRPLRETPRSTSHALANRSLSRVSNISKKRLTPGCHLPAASRSGHGHRNSRCRSTSSSLRSLRASGVFNRSGYLQEFAGDMMTVFNQFLDRTKKLEALTERDLTHHARETRIYQEELRKAETENHCLKDCVKDLEGEVERLKNALDKSSQKNKKMEKKYESFRSFLNDAIQEQQNLFKESQKRFQQTVGDLHTELATAKLLTLSTAKSVEQASPKLQLVMSQLKQVKGELESQAQQWGTETDNLRKELEARNVDLARERKTVLDLSQNLNIQNDVQANVRGLSKHAENIVQQLINQGKRSEQQKRMKEQEKLDYCIVVKAVESLKENARNCRDDVLLDLRKQQDLMATIMTKLDIIAKDQLHVKGATTRFESSLHSTDRAKQSLEAEVEGLQHQIYDASEQSQILQARMEEQELERAHLTIQLHQADEQVQAREAECFQLSQRLAELETIQAEVQILRGSTANKSEIISRLENELKGQQEATTKRDDELRDRSLTYMQDVRKVEEASKQAAEQVISSQRAQHVRDLEKNKETCETLMKQTKADARALGARLEEALLKVANMERDGQEDKSRIDKLSSELASCEARLVRVSESSGKKAVGSDRPAQELSLTNEGLQAELSRAKNSMTELLAEAQVYKDHSATVARKLQTWLVQHPNIQALGAELSTLGVDHNIARNMDLRVQEL